MKQLHRQEGIGQLLLVGIVAIVFVVVGLAVWQSQQSSKKSGETVQSSPTPTVSAQTHTPQATATPAQASLTLRELGIKIPLTQGIGDLVYSARTSNGVTAVSFSSSSIVASGGKYCAADADGPLGTIDLVTPGPSSETTIKKLGNKSLNYAAPQSVCASDSATQSLVSSQETELMAALQLATAE